MRKFHTILASFAAAALGASVVIGGYAILRQTRSANREAARKAELERRIHRVQKVEPVVETPVVSDLKSAPPKNYDLKSIPPMPGNLPDKEELREQFLMLKSFLELPPERLARIRQSIEKIEAMPPEQKARLLAQIRNGNAATETSEARIAHANAIFQNLPEETRALITFRTKGYTKERRASFIEGYAAACIDTLKKPTPAATPAK